MPPKKDETNGNSAQQNNQSTTPPGIVLKPGEVVVSQETLQKVLAGQAELERQLEEERGKTAGIAEMFEAQKGGEANGEKKLREKKNYEPAFRTVRLRQFPIANDPENLGWVVGWTDRGAYQKVDRSGVAPVLVDYIDIFFLGQERNGEGKLQAESVPLLSLINQGVQKHCKILSREISPRKQPTFEEIRVTTWDPAHGMMETGDIIDGFVGYTDITYKLQVPGIAEPITIDGKYVN